MEYFGYYLLIGFVLGGISILKTTPEEIEAMEPELKAIHNMIGFSGMLLVAMLLWPLVLMLQIMGE